MEPIMVLETFEDLQKLTCKKEFPLQRPIIDGTLVKVLKPMEQLYIFDANTETWLEFINDIF